MSTLLTSFFHRAFPLRLASNSCTLSPVKMFLLPLHLSQFLVAVFVLLSPTVLRSQEDSPATLPEIKNPFYPKSVWRLWAETPEGLTLTVNGKQETFAPPAEEKRRYPSILDDAPLTGMPDLLPQSDVSSSVAGFWDDAYMSLDNGHSNLRNPNGQFVIAPKVPTGMSEQEVRLRFALGVNFTSQSYARRGRHIVDDQASVLNLERFFYFANCVRATPAHASFNDSNPDQVHDDYDGLFGHSYQSVGQSSSEIRALEKMLIAGGCLSREIKDRIKKHGVYPSALLAMFKAALPYADASGEPLPYEHEMRHRPAYSSSGDVGHPHYCVSNVHYHGYDENRHLANMVEIARSLNAAPPVAILRLVALSVEKEGQTLVDQATEDRRVKSATPTQTRIWGNEGETLKLTIDLSSSYDLQDRALTFNCQPLYPNQKNVTVEDQGAGKFVVSARHDPKLPKGRLPVICTVNNGGALASSPVFVNFYWNEPDENPDFADIDPNRLPPAARQKYEESLKLTGSKRYPVTVNLRPKVEFALASSSIRCKPGQTVTVPFEASDPEGFPLTVYRRTGEPGKLDEKTFVFEVPKDAPESVQQIHLVFSDGTGGFTGKRLQFLISANPDSLPQDWNVAVLGSAPVASTVALNDKGEFAFGPATRRDDKRVNGTFFYRKLSEDGDLISELPSEYASNGVALMIRAGLEDHYRFVAISGTADGIAASYKTAEAGWNSQTIQSETGSGEGVTLLRLSRRGKHTAAFRSANGKLWEQLGCREMKLGNALAGILYPGGDAAKGQIRLEESSLPLLRLEGDAKGKWIAPFELKIDSPTTEPHVILHYTLDGTDPTPDSPTYTNSITIAEPGRTEVRVAAFATGSTEPSSIVKAVLDVQAPEVKK